VHLLFLTAPGQPQPFSLPRRPTRLQTHQHQRQHQPLSDQVSEYISTFDRYKFLWTQDLQATYDAFMRTAPSLEAFEAELRKYNALEQEIAAIPTLHNIGAAWMRLLDGSCMHIYAFSKTAPVVTVLTRVGNGTPRQTLDPFLSYE
jgi:hypothetical protein